MLVDAVRTLRCVRAGPGLLLVAAVLTALLLSACTNPPRVSPVPESADLLSKGRWDYAHGDFFGALDRFAQVRQLGLSEDNLFTQVVAELNLALIEQQLVRADRASATAHIERAMAAYERATALVPTMLAEQPNVNQHDLHLLLGEYHEARAQQLRDRALWDEMALALDESERHYLEALE